MKRFLSRLALCGVPFLLLLSAVVLYYRFGVFPTATGDLGRLGGIRFDRTYGDSIAAPRLTGNAVVEFSPQTDLDSTGPVCMTIGDSFSQQRIRGYQNFMAHRLGEPVVNLHSMWSSPMQAAVCLLNTGFFDTWKPRTLILETAGRHLPDQLLEIDFDLQREVDKMISLTPEEDPEDRRRLTFTSTIKMSFNWLQLRFKRSPVRTLPLETELFGVHPRQLHFYYRDHNALTCTDQQVAGMQRALEELHRRFRERGIELIFMVAVDKYDLYQDYIAGPHPAKDVLERMEQGCDSALFFSTKRVLQPLVQAGVRDVFRADDSHWSQTGADTVAAELVRMIRATAEKESRP